MNLAISQNRHILSMLGVSLWATRTHASRSVPVMASEFDKFGQSSFEGFGVGQVNEQPNVTQTDLEPTNQPKHDDEGLVDDIAPTFYSDELSTDIDDVSADFADEFVHSATDDVIDSQDIAHTKHTQPPTQTDTPPTPVVATPKLDIRYQLKGVRFGRWVLVIDMQYVDTDVHSVWLSLCEALERQAQRTHAPYRTHDISYPLVHDDYAEHQDFAPANHACLGFVLGLAMPELASVQIGLLTPLTAGLSIDNALTLTDIRLLARHDELKKAFWGFVNQ